MEARIVRVRRVVIEVNGKVMSSPTSSSRTISASYIHGFTSCLLTIC
jgi:hypothetical protein